MLSKMSYKRLIGIVLIVSIFLFASKSFLYAEEDMQQGLPSGPGVDLVLGNCTICHSTSIILQNHMDREAWDKTITWMQKEQGMWELEAGDRKAILEYLSKHQGINQNMNRNSKRKQSMYEFDYSANPL